MPRKTNDQIQQLVSGWRSLGPAAWAESNFILDTGEPIKLYGWQRGLLDAWWMHRHEVTTVAASLTKKTGKTSWNSILTAWRWLALPGTHFACANDEAQAVGRVFEMVSDAARHNSFLAGLTKFEKKRIVFEPTGSELIALPLDARGAAGSNFLTASFTELWGLVYTSGVEMWGEMTPPPLKKYGLPALRICDSYSGYEDLSKLWHELVDRGIQQGEQIESDFPIYKHEGLLLMHDEGEEAQRRYFPGTDTERVEYYAEQKRTLRPGQYSRLHLNRRAGSESQFVDDDTWRALIDPDHMPLEATRDRALFVGLDLAVSPNGDDAACSAWYADPPYVSLAWHRVWRGATRTRPLRLSETVIPFLLKRAQDYWISGVYYDEYQAKLLAEELSSTGINMIPVPQSQPSLGPLGQKMYEMAINGVLRLYPDDEVAAMASHAAVKEIPQGLHIRKAGRGKVDLLVCASFAAPMAWDGSPGLTPQEYADLAAWGKKVSRWRSSDGAMAEQSGWGTGSSGTARWSRETDNPDRAGGRGRGWHP